MYVGLINAVTMVITLGAWAAVASVLSRREEAGELERMRREVLREKEYKEVAAHYYIHATSILETHSLSHTLTYINSTIHTLKYA